MVFSLTSLLFSLLFVVLQFTTLTHGINTALVWNQQMLDAISATSTPPPRASRFLAILHGAMLTAFQRRGAGAANYAAHEILTSLYPTRTSETTAALNAYLKTRKVPQAAANAGRKVAADFLLSRVGDFTTDVAPTYKIVNGDGQWRPTAPAFIQTPLLPGAGDVKPFLIKNADDFVLDGPPAFETSQYRRDFIETLTFGQQRTKEQEDIAAFWAAGPGTVTPPGMWNLFAQSLIRSFNNRGQMTLRRALRILWHLNAAMADSGICCWRIKYKYNTWRPITAIANGTDAFYERLQIPRITGWKSYLTTPAFPEYTSGHSSFSGAAAGVLTGYFGNRVPRVTLTMGGITRSFTRIRAASMEAGKSRIYGGIHFEFSNGPALDMGRKIAAEILGSK